MTARVQRAQLKQRFHFIWSQIQHRLIWACNSTNLHGFKFVANKNASVVTRLSFAFISCLSLGLCSYLIMLQLYEYNQQFIVTRIISTSYPVWKFRFPSATICNFNVVYKNNIKNLMNVVTSHGVKEEIFMDFLQNLSSLIVYDDNLNSVDHYKEIYNVLEQNGYDVDRTMKELAQPCDSMVKRCFWRASEIPCSHIIQRIKTDNGYCCSFNYYGIRKPAESIIDPLNHNDTYMGLIGSNYGLRLVLDSEMDQYISSIKPSYGFNVVVQDGADYPDMLLTTNTLLTAEEMRISVKPSIYVSSKNVRNIDPTQRRCLFEDEGNIGWSSIHSYKTCLNECKANAIYQLCGCVPFYYSIRNHRRLCTFFDEACIELNQCNCFENLLKKQIDVALFLDKYTTLHVLANFVTNNKREEEETEEEEEEDVEDHIHCACYPQCNERIFNVQANRATVTSMIGYENENLSILNVYYDGDNCIKTQRAVYYTWYRILSAAGGIFSLCLGGSIISVAECVYIFGKCIFNYDNIQPNALNVSKPAEAHSNINASYQHTNKVKKTVAVHAKAQMFINAFGNHK